MNSMPLHPALVHLPIALLIFAPLFAAYVVREIARFQQLASDSKNSAKSDPENDIKNGDATEYARRRWRLVVVWAFAQTILIYATMMAGEQDADLLKAAVGASQEPGGIGTEIVSARAAKTLAAIDAHENAAGLLLLASGATLLAALIAWKPAPTARPWRLITIGVQIVALGVCLYTARLGGELVYLHGAAQVHTPDD